MLKKTMIFFFFFSLAHNKTSAFKTTNLTSTKGKKGQMVETKKRKELRDEDCLHRNLPPST